MPNPCPDCTANSAWGCPKHAPKRMEAAQSQARLEAIQNVLGPLALPNESEADVAKRIAAKAALWNEVGPLLKAWSEMLIMVSFPAERRLDEWACSHKSELEAL